MNHKTTPKEQNGYIEDTIILDETKEQYTYTLTNNLDDVKIAIYARTGHNINLLNSTWRINPKLSISVKYLMKKYNVIYSMTTWEKVNKKHITINMRVGSNWFITDYEEIDDEYYNWDTIFYRNFFTSFINKYFSNDSKGDNNEL